MSSRFALRVSFAASLVGMASACFGGASLDENTAGADGWLDHEPPPYQEDTAASYDDRCEWTGNPFVGVGVERAYSLLYTADVDCAEMGGYESIRKTVWGLTPDASHPELLIDVTGHEDVRLLSTAAGLLLLGEHDGLEHLYRIDDHTLEVLAERTTTARYWGTRTSPSRSWVAVADNAVLGSLPLHVIDPVSLLAADLDPTADWIEATWLHESDTLIAILFDSTGARIVAWDLDGAALSVDEATGEARLPAPAMEIGVPEIRAATGFFESSLTWITVDPTDRFVVFPVYRADHTPTLVILDRQYGAIRTFDGPLGPVAFTPDGSSIVAWQEGDVPELLIIDPVTLESETIPLPILGTAEFFVSHEGNLVLVSSVYGGQNLVLVDLDNGTETVLDLTLALDAFSSRLGHDEVWFATGDLLRIDLAAAEVEAVPVSFAPEHVVWMPESDLLFLDDRDSARMILWDPTTRSTVTDVTLSDDDRGRPRLSLALLP